MASLTGFKVIVPKKRMVILHASAISDPPGDDQCVGMGLLEVLSILVSLRDGSVDYVVRAIYDLEGSPTEDRDGYFRLSQSAIKVPGRWLRYISDAWDQSADKDEFFHERYGACYRFRKEMSEYLRIPMWRKSKMAELELARTLAMQRIRRRRESGGSGSEDSK